MLEAITSLGGDHGPSDALFNSTYVIPFLGLDKQGPRGLDAWGALGALGALAALAFARTTRRRTSR